MKQYKAVFVDFDNTLCLHKRPIDYTSADIMFPALPYNIDERVNRYFGNSIENTTLIDILKKMKGMSLDTKFYILTTAGSKQRDLKLLWLTKHDLHEFFDEVLSVSDDCSKSEVIASYKKHYNLNANDILFLDNRVGGWNDLMQLGICDAYAPQTFTEMVLQEK